MRMSRGANPAVPEERLHSGGHLSPVAVLSVLALWVLVVETGTDFVSRNLVFTPSVLEALQHAMMLLAGVVPGLYFFVFRPSARYTVQRRQLEAELTEARDLLEAQVLQRTTELVAANRALETKMDELQSAEQALRDSEERYRTLFVLAGDAFLTALAPEGRITDANEAAVQMLRYSKEELIGSLARSLAAPEVVEEAARAWPSQVEAAGFFLLETVWVRKDGSRVPVEISGKPFTLGDRVYFQLIGRDITGRRRAEEALRTSLEESRKRSQGTAALLVAARSILESHNFNDAAQSIIESCRSLVGSSRGCLALANKDTKTWNVVRSASGEITPADDCALAVLLPGLHEEVFRSRKAVYRNELRRDHAMRLDGNGSPIPDNVLLAPLAVNGSTLGVICLSDKQGGFGETHAKVASAFAELAAVALINFQTAEELERSEERFRRLAENAQDVIYRYDLQPAKGLSYISPAITRVSGYSPDEYYADADLFRRVLGAQGSCVPPVYDDPGGNQRTQTIPLVHKNGTTVWVDIREAIIYDGESAVAIEGIARDVTERKHMEERLLRAQRLETAGLVAGQVAHDLNNLLGPMLGFPELIKRRLPDGHPAIRYCDAMLEVVPQMAEVSENMLALGRRGQIHQEMIGLNGLVRQALSQAMELPATITVNLDLDTHVLPVNGSRSQLLRVVSNLISNAGEAVSNIGVISLRTRNWHVSQPLGRYNENEPGEYAVIEVSDTGPGIPSEIMDKIFDPFFTTKRPDRRCGSGLGLSIVQSIVNDHGGYVDVESAPGAGTTFRVCLPACWEALQHTASQDIPSDTRSALVVDNDPAQRFRR